MRYGRWRRAADQMDEAERGPGQGEAVRVEVEAEVAQQHGDEPQPTEGRHEGEGERNAGEIGGDAAEGHERRPHPLRQPAAKGREREPEPEEGAERGRRGADLEAQGEGQPDRRLAETEDVGEGESPVAVLEGAGQQSRHRENQEHRREHEERRDAEPRRPVEAPDETEGGGRGHGEKRTGWRLSRLSPAKLYGIHMSPAAARSEARRAARGLLPHPGRACARPGAGSCRGGSGGGSRRTSEFGVLPPPN